MSNDKLISVAQKISGIITNKQKAKPPDTQHFTNKITHLRSEITKLNNFVWENVSQGLLTKELVDYKINRCAMALDATKDAIYKHIDIPSESKISTKHIIAELQSLESIFGNLVINDTYISVKTKPITLEDVELGRFEIRLKLDSLIDIRNHKSFVAIALDPNPSACDDRVTHPHVSGDKICFGEIYGDVDIAINGGNLELAFTIINNLLETYNDKSPHEPLEDWGNYMCPDCGGNCDELMFCRYCQNDICEDCGDDCKECGEYMCGHCCISCYSCDSHICRDCADNCDKCGNKICEDCHKLCSKCGECVCCNKCVTDDERCGECEDIMCEDHLSNCGNCNRNMCSECYHNDECNVLARG